MEPTEPHASLHQAPRIAWLDSARGLGIVLVVAGHTFTTAQVHAVIYVFHMPLFFGLAGMVFSPVPWREFAGRRLLSLALPYAAYFILVTLLDIVLSWAAGHRPYLDFFSPTDMLIRPLFGGELLKGVYGTFWFLTCLAGTQAAANLIRRPRLWIAVACLAVASVTPHIKSPGNLLAVPMALAFFICGWAYRQHGAERLPSPLPVVASIALLLLVPVVRPMDMKYLDYGTPLLTPLAALGCSFAVILLCRSLGAMRPLALLGRASLVIMFLHLTVVVNGDGIMPRWLILVLGLGLPTLAFLLFERIPLLDRLFLGGRGRARGGTAAPAR